MKYFDKLTTNEKAEIVFGMASYINSINYYNQTVMLYELDNVLFEVFYNKEENEILEILLADKNRLHLYCPTLSELKQGM